MELKITVSEADFGAELKDILDSLSQEEKKEIAKEVLLKSLNEITDCQRTLAEKELNVFKQIKDSLYSGDKDRYKTDEDLRGHYKYNELMRAVKSSKEKALEEVLKSAIDTFKSSAQALVENDEKLKEIWIASSEVIKEDFPKYIHSAMTYYFASKLSEMQSGIQNAIMESGQARFNTDNILARIGR